MTTDDTSLDPHQLSEFYRTSFTAMNQSFCVLEKVETAPNEAPDFRCLLVNPAFEQQTGRSQVVGKNLRQVIPGIEEHIMALYERVAVTGEPVQFE